MGKRGDGTAFLTAQRPGGTPLPADPGTDLAGVLIEHRNLHDIEAAVLALDVFQCLDRTVIQCLDKVPTLQVHPESPLHIFLFRVIIGHIKGQLYQLCILPVRTDGLQILQTPDAAEGLVQNGVLRGVISRLQLAVEKITGLLDGGVERDQDAQRFRIVRIRLFRVCLDLPHRQRNAGKSGLRAGEIVVAQVLRQLFKGLGGAAGEGGNTGGKQVGHHALRLLQTLQLLLKFFLLGRCIRLFRLWGLSVHGFLFCRPGGLLGALLRNI